jgi:hypothetical protein
MDASSAIFSWPSLTTVSRLAVVIAIPICDPVSKPTGSPKRSTMSPTASRVVVGPQ